jgi:hypothetical protein
MQNVWIGYGVRETTENGRENRKELLNEKGKQRK